MFRKYNLGDERGITVLLKECFDSYRRWNITEEDWLSLRDDNSGFTDSLIFVAEEDGDIVGHVQAVLRELRINGHCVNFGGIANVATKPSYRGRGIAFNLLKMTHEGLREKGIGLALLYTGLRGVPHRLYRRLGYADVTLMRREICNVEDVVDEIGMYKLSFKVREIERRDEEVLLKLYEKWSQVHGGICRPKNYWDRILGNRKYYHTFFYDTRGVVGFIAEKGNKPKGYAVVAVPKLMSRNTWIQKDSAEIIDIVYENKGAAYALLERCAKILKQVGIKELIINSPETMLGNSQSVKEGTVLMGMLINQETFMKEMVNVLNKRLAKTGLGGEMSIRVETSYGAFTLKMRGEEITVSNNGSDNKIRIKDGDFIGLILGFKDFNEVEIEEANLVSIKWANLRTILQTLFPKRAPYIQPIDMW